MSAATETRADLVRRCRSLERRFIRISEATGRDCSIAITWAQQWRDALLDTTGMASLYRNFIEQQEARAKRLERMMVQA